MRNYLLFLIMLCALFFMIAAPTYTNTGSHNIVDNGVLFRAGESTESSRYHSHDDLSLASHFPAPATWPISNCYQGAIVSDYITPSQAYDNISVTNESGAELSVYFNEDSTTSKQLKIPDGTAWVLDNSDHRIGTIHLSGSGSGDVTVQQYN
jgi:hypothetical protein